MCDSILFFSAPWCQPCRGFKPVLSAVLQGRGIPLLNIDVAEEANVEHKESFDITGVPTIVAMRDGKEVARNVGPMTPLRLNEWIDNL